MPYGAWSRVTKRYRLNVMVHSIKGILYAIYSFDIIAEFGAIGIAQNGRKEMDRAINAHQK